MLDIELTGEYRKRPMLSDRLCVARVLKLSVTSLKFNRCDAFAVA